MQNSVPSLFQIAAFFDDFFPPSSPAPSGKTVKDHPIAEYMLNPEKLMRVLLSAKVSSTGDKERTRSDAAAKRHVRARLSAKKSSRSGQTDAVAEPPQRSAAKESLPEKESSPQKSNGSNDDESPTKIYRKVEFSFRCESAQKVTLAGDFTGWEKHPVELSPSRNGVWYTVLPLEPGSYSYRFIVDGQWCDDPKAEHSPNPFGSHNCVVHVK